MILSNNRSSRRVETFCSQLGIRYVGHAGKPKTRGYREAMALAGAPPGETAMLGDKLLTDVLGARRSGVRYIAEPGGSIRDDLVIAKCNDYDMVMAFTGVRLFHH